MLFHFLQLEWQTRHVCLHIVMRTSTVRQEEPLTLEKYIMEPMVFRLVQGIAGQLAMVM